MICEGKIIKIGRVNNFLQKIANYIKKHTDTS